MVRPRGLAATRWDALVAWACCGALGAILLVELATPTDVVAALGLIPLTVAMWALSTRLALRVSLVAAVGFAVMLVTEVANRPTVLLIVAVAIVLGGAVRLYANVLSGVLPVTRPVAIALDAASGVYSLTRRELDVARLASRGYTAGEIGASLHISDRTVESHLANAYDKLGIHSRSGLRELDELLK